MAAPTVYRWDDPEAPVLAGQFGSVTNLLRKVLVDGYGEKASLGWTLEFVDAQEEKMVFRNNPVAGTGFFLRVDHSSTNELPASVQYAAELRGYESMADIDNGNGSFPLNSYRCFRASNANSTSPRPWVVIGDDRCFYCMVFWSCTTGDPTDNTWRVSASFFGDIISLVPGDEWGCVLLGPSSYSNWEMLGYYSGSFAHYTRCSDGVVPTTATEQGCGMRSGGGPCVAASISGRYGPSEQWNGQWIFSRPHLKDRGSESYSFRGYMPGFWDPQHAEAFDNLQQVAQGDLDLMAFLTYRGGNNGQYMIDLGPGFRP